MTRVRASRYRALATDYDGTIATDGVVDEATVAALRKVRGAGLRLILVTGRQFDDLVATFPHTDLFDRVVAENGAILYDPAAAVSRTLAPPPPRELVDLLAARNVPVSVGRAIIATVDPCEHVLRSTIHDLGLDWHVILNKGSVMALPSGITKATGLVSALEDLNVSAAYTVGVGDAENDHAFLQLCGTAVAVANALDGVKKGASFVTQGRAGSGVRELIDLILAGELADTSRPTTD